ncbi:hypothetical protein [Nitrosopumilus ureiphilus]|nr:hypothetical protein [Nitrosopumilus ureiphilus]
MLKRIMILGGCTAGSKIIQGFTQHSKSGFRDLPKALGYKE